jgi:hypothetical protein
MGTLRLQVQHFRSKLSNGQHPAGELLEFLADLVILAENAGKIAAGKKNGP